MQVKEKSFRHPSHPAFACTRSLKIKELKIVFPHFGKPDKMLNFILSINVFCRELIIWSMGATK